MSLAIGLIPNLIWGTNLLLIAGILAGIIELLFITPFFYASITMFYDAIKEGSIKKQIRKLEEEQEEAQEEA